MLLLIGIAASVGFSATVAVVKEDFTGAGSAANIDQEDANDEVPRYVGDPCDPALPGSGFTWGGYVAGVTGTKNANVKIVNTRGVRERLRIGEGANVAGTYAYTIFDPNLADGNNGDVDDPNVQSVDMSLGSAKIITEIRRADDTVALLYLIRDKFGNWFKSNWGNSVTGRGYISIGTAGMFWLPLDSAGIANLNLLAGGDEMALVEDFAGPFEDISAVTGGGIYINDGGTSPNRLIIERMRWSDGTVPLNDSPGVYAGYNWPSDDGDNPAVYPWDQPTTLDEAEVWDDIVINPLDIPIEWSVVGTPNDSNFSGYAYDPNIDPNITQTWGYDANLAALVSISNTTTLHPTVTLPPYTGDYELMLTATDPYDANLTEYSTVTLTFTGNLPPDLVDANDYNDVILNVDPSLQLAGYYIDDGEVNDIADVITWSVIDGPNLTSPSFSPNNNNLDSTVTFSEAGLYTLQLDVNDGEHVVSDTTEILVWDKLLQRFEANDPNFIEDTWVEENNANNNRGGDTIIQTEGDEGQISNGYLKFDTSGIAGNIVTADLRLHAASGTHTSVTAHAVTYGPSGEWVEGAGDGEVNDANVLEDDWITWNNDDLEWQTALDVEASIADETKRTFNVQKMMIESDGKATIGLKGTDNASKNFASVEHGTQGKRPRLIIYYDPDQAYDEQPHDTIDDVIPELAALTWTKGAAATAVDVYFGDDPCALSLLSAANATGTADPCAGDLIEGRTYYWRANGNDGTNGELWSFTVLTNQAPTIDAGPDATTSIGGGGTADMNSTAADDYIPGGGSLAYTWSKVSGPGTVGFSTSANVEDPTASFSAPGDYTLMVSVTDGVFEANDTVDVQVFQNEIFSLSITDPNLIEDTFVQRNKETQNFGASDNFKLRDFYHNQGRKGYLKVDLSSVAGNIKEAKLTLHCNSNGFQDTTAFAVTYGPSGEWIEGTLDGEEPNATNGADPNSLMWSNDDMLWQSELDTHTDMNNGDKRDFDITGLITESDGKATIGLKRFNTATDSKNWASSDHSNASERPILTVYYDPNQAWNEQPRSGMLELDPNVGDLTWTMGAAATSVTVNFGIGSEANLAEVDTGNAAGSYTVGALAEETTYFWSIDGDDGTPGEVWSFTTLTNDTPVVDAGPVGVAYLAAGGTADMNGTVTDSYTPIGGELTYLWEAVNVPAGGGVSFAPGPNALDPTATFSGAIGDYVLKLTASDGDLDANDTVNVTVYQKVLQSVVIENIDVPNEPNIINIIDAYTNNQNANNRQKHYGGNNPLQVNSDSPVKNTFIAFDRSAIDGGIVQATLTLRVKDANDPAPQQVDAYSVNYLFDGNDWAENVLLKGDIVYEANGHDPNLLTQEWESQNLEFGDLLDSLIGFVEDEFVDFDITGIRANSSGMASIALASSTGIDDDIRFASTEAGTTNNRPKITVVYDPNLAWGLKPLDGTLHVPTDVNLTWQTGTAVTSVDVYLGLDPNALPAVDTGNTSGLYAASGLIEGETYHWKIVSNDGTETAVQSFTVLLSNIQLYVIPASDDASFQTGSAADKNYGAGERLNVRNNDRKRAFLKFNIGEALGGPIAGNVVSATLKVKTWSGSNQAVQTSAWDVTVDANTVNWEEGGVTDNSGVNVDPNDPNQDNWITFNRAANVAWTKELDSVDNGGINLLASTVYDFDVSDANFWTPDSNLTLGLTTTDSNNSRRWQAKEKAGEGIAGEGPRLFLEININQAYAPNPGNNDTEVIPDTMLSWTNGQLATGGDVWFGTDPCAMANLGSGATSFDPSPAGELDVNTIYFWRIVGNDGTDGQIWSFTTTLVHPDEPVLTSPNQDQTRRVYDQMVFEWEHGDSNQPDYWDMYISNDFDDVNTMNPAAKIANVTTPYDLLPDVMQMNINDIYYWRIEADVTGPNGPWQSAVGRFITNDVDRLETFEDGAGNWVGGTLDPNVNNGSAGDANSLKVEYDSSATGVTEATMTLPWATRDWTAATGRRSLRVTAKGRSTNDLEDVYITLTDGTLASDTVGPVTSNQDMNRPEFKGFFNYDVDLEDFAIDLTQVKSLTFAIGDGAPQDANGILNLDAIQLHTPKCRDFKLGQNNIAGNGCRGDMDDLRILSRDWLDITTTVNAQAVDNNSLIAYLEFEEIPAVIDTNAMVTSIVPYDDSNYASWTLAGPDIPNDVNVGVPGYTGNCWEFYGAYLGEGGGDFNYAPLIEDDNEITVSMWTLVDANFAVLRQDNNLTFDPQQAFRLRQNGSGSDNNNRLRLFALQNDGDVQGGNGAFPNVDYFVGTFDELNRGAWHHIALVLDSDAQRLEVYYDGVRGEIDESDNPLPPLIGDGKSLTNIQMPWSNYTGKIDTVKIFDRALSPGEIVTLAGLGSVEQPVTTDADINDDGIVNFTDLGRLLLIWADEQILWP
jgi:hypothetical protein